MSPRARKVCPVLGCFELTAGGRCTKHTREADKARGTRTERGYGPDHQAERATIQARIDAGHAVTCWHCGAQLHGRAWHLDHTDDRTAYRGPTCPTCNLHLAGLRGGGQGGRTP